MSSHLVLRTVSHDVDIDLLFALSHDVQCGGECVSQGGRLDPRETLISSVGSPKTATSVAVVVTRSGTTASLKVLATVSEQGSRLGG